jgi:hypothetical protein
VVQVRPLRPAPFGALSVSGIRLGDAEVTISVDGSGAVSLSGLPDGLRVSDSA